MLSAADWSIGSISALSRRPPELVAGVDTEGDAAVRSHLFARRPPTGSVAGTKRAVGTHWAPNGACHLLLGPLAGAPARAVQPNLNPPAPTQFRSPGPAATETGAGWLELDAVRRRRRRGNELAPVGRPTGFGFGRANKWPLEGVDPSSGLVVIYSLERLQECELREVRKGKPTFGLHSNYAFKYVVCFC